MVKDEAIQPVGVDYKIFACVIEISKSNVSNLWSEQEKTLDQVQVENCYTKTGLLLDKIITNVAISQIWS